MTRIGLVSRSESLSWAHALLGEADAALKHLDKAVYLGLADPKQLERGLELCGRSDTDEGRKLMKRAQMQASKSKQKELEKKKAAAAMGAGVQPAKKTVARVDATKRP